MIIPNMWKNEFIFQTTNQYPGIWSCMIPLCTSALPTHADLVRHALAKLLVWGLADQRCAVWTSSFATQYSNVIFEYIWNHKWLLMTLDDFRIFRIARFLTYPHLSWRNNGTWDNGKSRGTVAPAFATRLRFLKEILPVSSSSKSRKAFKISSFGSRFRILWVIIFRNLADQDAYVDWWLIPRTHTDIYIYTNKLESDWITRVIW